MNVCLSGLLRAAAGVAELIYSFELKVHGGSAPALPSSQVLLWLLCHSGEETDDPWDADLVMECRACTEGTEPGNSLLSMRRAL